MTTTAIRTQVASCPAALAAELEREQRTLMGHEADLLASTSDDERAAQAFIVRRCRRIVAALTAEVEDTARTQRVLRSVS